MSEEKSSTAKGQPLWDERDELRRLDSVAGVVVAASLAGCLASAALIATGRLVEGASYALGATGLVLLGCAALATLSLAWSPLEAIEEDPELKDIVKTKRSRTRTALSVLVITVLLGFGATTVIEVASHSDDGHAQQERGAHSEGSRSHQQ
ncbi:MAG TPA: hypothetical protein VMS60_06405 [Solirubrobacterales bacterium]|nr:hypothetical protein [Solirubrobacterales bacterium]